MQEVESAEEVVEVNRVQAKAARKAARAEKRKLKAEHVVRKLARRAEAALVGSPRPQVDAKGKTKVCYLPSLNVTIHAKVMLNGSLSPPLLLLPYL